MAQETKRVRFEVKIGPGGTEPGGKSIVIITFTRSKTDLRIVTASCKEDKISVSLTTKKCITSKELAYRLQSRLWWKVDSIKHGRRLSAALSSVIAQLKKV